MYLIKKNKTVKKKENSMSYYVIICKLKKKCIFIKL
jgi:hypothetical protein